MSKVFHAAMLSHYIDRTFRHIHFVQKRAVSLANYCISSQNGLFDREREIFSFLHAVSAHDHSKFSPEQWPIYCIMSYKRNITGEDLTEDEKIEFEKAFRDHYFREYHHPEMTTNNERSYYWGKTSALHCACDLQAMADEFGEGSARKYFNNIWWPKYGEIVTKKSIETDNMGRFDVKSLMEKCFEIWERIDSK